MAHVSSSYFGRFPAAVHLVMIARQRWIAAGSGQVSSIARRMHAPRALSRHRGRRTSAKQRAKASATRGLRSSWIESHSSRIPSHAGPMRRQIGAGSPLSFEQRASAEGVPVAAGVAALALGGGVGALAEGRTTGTTVVGWLERSHPPAARRTASSRNRDRSMRIGPQTTSPGATSGTLAWMPLAHHPSAEVIASWPAFTPEAPLRVLVSGCLAGLPCGVDGTAYGDYPLARHLLALPNVEACPFCPEERAYGTPRDTPNVHDGDGFDVLDGRATVRMDTDAEPDVTAALVEQAHAMARFALERRAHLALLMDVSGACGSTVHYVGRRRDKRYLRGPGVAAAAIIRAGIPVTSQRDERTLAAIFAKLGAEAGAPLGDRLDFHERDWYRGYFGVE